MYLCTCYESWDFLRLQNISYVHELLQPSRQKKKKRQQKKKEKTSPLPPPKKKNTHSGKIGIQNVFILYIQQTHRCVEGAVEYINVDVPKQTYAWC